MAPSRNCSSNGLIVVIVTLGLVFSLSFLPPKIVCGLASGDDDGESSVKQREMVLGSKPPGCVNKCMSCRPCMATLVVPSHQRKRFTTFVKALPSAHGDDNSYYLLSWKCRCGDKLFQP